MRHNNAPKAVSPVARKIGKHIFARRSSLGLTQAAVRSKAKLSPAHFCDVENGKVRVGAESLHRISKALDVPMTYFFEPLSG